MGAQERVQHGKQDLYVCLLKPRSPFDQRDAKRKKSNPPKPYVSNLRMRANVFVVSIILLGKNMFFTSKAQQTLLFLFDMVSSR